MLRLCFCDALYNSRFSKGALETGALTLIEWITCCGNYKHGAGIYIRHPVEKWTTLMALSERWSNKISFVYTTYFIKVSALPHSDSLKAISSIFKKSSQNILLCGYWFLLHSCLAKLFALRSHFHPNGRKEVQGGGWGASHNFFFFFKS